MMLPRCPVRVLGHTLTPASSASANAHGTNVRDFASREAGYSLLTVVPNTTVVALGE